LYQPGAGVFGKGLDAERALIAGMEEKAQEFREAGGKTYQKV
jgi:hypothetical protein